MKDSLMGLKGKLQTDKKILVGHMPNTELVFRIQIESSLQ